MPWGFSKYILEEFERNMIMKVYEQIILFKMLHAEEHDFTIPKGVSSYDSTLRTPTINFYSEESY